jgi:regulator of telomere elongation helicase 1
MKYTIDEIEVDFPHEAYPCQIKFMESCIRALSEPTNAILESPTGTGKTLCLLCACLAYQQHIRKKEGKAFKIFYSSRTHSQLTQVIKELRTTAYHDEARTAVLGSRDQLCVEPVVSQHRGAILNSQCKRLLRNKACSYGNAVTRASGPEHAPTVLNCADIEDLAKIGSSRGFCPFYQSRELSKFADIVFLPYNYIVDFRENFEGDQGTLDLGGSIVIIDEAHNIERVCEDAATISFGTLDIFHSIRMLERAIESVSVERQLITRGDERREDSSSVQQINSVELSLSELIKTLKNVLHLLSKFDFTGSDNTGRRERGITGQDFVAVFVNAGCNKVNYRSFLQTIETAQERNEDDASLGAFYLGNLKDVITLLFGAIESGHELDEYFRAFIQAGDSRSGGNAGDLGNDVRVVSLYCLSASIAMRRLVEKKKVRNILLASGTLSPLGIMQQSLGIPFGVVLQNTHVIDPSKQLLVGAVCTGPSKVPLNAAYQNKENADYLNDLGNLVVNVCHTSPEGALLVFHAYAQMYLAIRTWENNGIYSRINREKTVFVEPKNAGELSDVMDQFRATTLNNSGGAILFCVCRGKVTEGVDLADNQCRLVMVVGIPFPSVMDRKVILKRELLDSKNSGDGSKWYVQEATRAVNQTIGRVIRHRNDYGAILLLDERFRSYVGPDSLPRWVQGRVKMYPYFGPVQKDLTDFFRTIHADVKKTTSSGRVLGRNNSLNMSGDGTWNADKQLESIQKLITAVPAGQRIVPSFPTNLPAKPTDQENAFKISAPIAARPLARKVTTDVSSSSAPSSQCAGYTPVQWIHRMKSLLNRRDYVLLKQNLRRLLEGAHGQCNFTVMHSLSNLKDLLEKANMLESFNSVIAGPNELLRSCWAELNKKG